MTGDLVPADLRDFINKYIDSIAHLEALLLLRDNPAENWDAARAARRLYVSENEAAEILAHLCADKLITCDAEIYRFGCETSELETLVDRLADVYSRHLIPVTNMIHSKPRRIRQFADAFKFRKDR